MDLSTSLYSVGFPPTRLLFAAKYSSTRSFIAVGEDSGTSSVASGDGGRELTLEALDLLQSVGWAAGSPSRRTWKRWEGGKVVLLQNLLP